MDIHNKKGICRVCLSKVKKKSMSLFEEYKNFMIFNYINDIANVQIRKDDGLPNKICPSCLLELETAINFKQKCESSNIVLQTSTLTNSADTGEAIDYKEVIVKKEEPQDETEYLDQDANYFESDLYDVDDDDKKPVNALLNKVELGLRPSRALDLQLQCDDCKAFFKSKCKLRVHWKKVHLREVLKCHDCRRVFKSYKAFNRHKKTKTQSCASATNFRIEGEGKLRRFFCKECDYKSIRMKDMISHWVVHTGDRPYQCEICSKTCTQLSSLEAHRESAHKQYKIEITCHYCGKYVKGRNRIYRHFKVHTAKQVQCVVCQKMFANKTSLRVHMQRHSGVKAYACEICAMTFYTASELSNHKRIVHNKDKTWYYCDICNYKAHKNDVIKRHKSKHSASNIPCTICGVFLENAQKLFLHQRRHFEEKKHQCPYCELKFFRRDSVSKHIKAKHKCTFLPNQKPSVNVKKESPPISNQYEDVVEIELSPDTNN